MPVPDVLNFDYQIVRSARKSLAVHVQNGQVQVRAPLRLATAQIQGFVTKKSRWISRKLELQQIQAGEVYRLCEGEPVPFLGRELILNVRQAGRNRVDIDSDVLRIEGRTISEDKLKTLWRNWLKQQARDFMVPRTRRLAESLGVSDRLTDIGFRCTKSKWGHCSVRGEIQYNPHIMMAPEPVVNYLMVHEVCHLIHMNHSVHYWQQVADVCPGYQVQRLWLKQNGHRFREL